VHSTEVGPPADVFALGAILCEVLTGCSPYCDAPPRELLTRARTGDLGATADRLAASGAPQELVDLCLRCTSTNWSARPRDSSAVVEAILAWERDTQFRDREAAVSLSVNMSRRLQTSRLEQTLFGLVGSGLLAVAAVAAIVVFALGAFGLLAEVTETESRISRGGVGAIGGVALVSAIASVALSRAGSRRQLRYQPPPPGSSTEASKLPASSFGFVNECSSIPPSNRLAVQRGFR